MMMAVPTYEPAAAARQILAYASVATGCDLGGDE
jgi:hypothetical protein